MKTYIVIKDYQGGEFGMYRNYTAEEWGEQAYWWADSDGWDDADECLLKNFKNERELIDFITEIWELELVEANKNNKKVIDYLEEIINNKYSENNQIEWAKNVLEEMEVD